MASIRIEVVYATRASADAVTVELPEGATVREALHAAGIKEAAALGIFGRRVAAETPLAHGDRVEIYRPLMLDPKERRRERARRRRR
jgi:putative ubiquitin-RnfH superfamily antitoxin RatB of RatAB toxin-antitoxin module